MAIIRKGTKTLSEGGRLTPEQLEYVFRPLYATDLPGRCADVLRLHGIRNLAGVLSLERNQLDSLFSGNAKMKPWLMDCLSKHGLQDKFGLRMDNRSDMNVRNYDIRPNVPDKKKHRGIGL